MALNAEGTDYDVGGVKPCWGRWKWFVLVALRDQISSAAVMSSSKPLGAGFSTRAGHRSVVMKLYFVMG